MFAYRKLGLTATFAICELRRMTEAHRERFIAAQIAGLKALGLTAAALAREESLLRAGFAQRGLFRALFEGARHGG